MDRKLRFPFVNFGANMGCNKEKIYYGKKYPASLGW